MKKSISQRRTSADVTRTDGTHFSALRALKVDDLETGELKRLIAEGDKSIKTEGTLDLDDALAQLRAERAK